MAFFTLLLLLGDGKEDVVGKEEPKSDKKKKSDSVSNGEEPPVKKSKVIEEVTSKESYLTFITLWSSLLCDSIISIVLFWWHIWNIWPHRLSLMFVSPLSLFLLQLTTSKSKTWPGTTPWRLKSKRPSRGRSFPSRTALISSKRCSLRKRWLQCSLFHDFFLTVLFSMDSVLEGRTFELRFVA